MVGRVTAPQVDAFRRDGYLILDPFFDDSEVGAIRTALEQPAFVEAMANRGIAGQIFQLEDLDPLFWQLARDPRILDAVEAILGGNIQLQHSKLTYKTPGAGMLQWHQDFAYTPHSCPDLLSVALYVDNATVANGCMTMVAGSHREGLRHHYAGDRFTGICQEADAYTDVARHRLVEVGSGGLSLHHSLILHGSVPHSSDGQRRIIVFGYRASHSVQLGGAVFANTGQQVRGVFDGVVRCTDMTLRLPPQPDSGGLRRRDFSG